MVPNKELEKKRCFSSVSRANLLPTPCSQFMHQHIGVQRSVCQRNCGPAETKPTIVNSTKKRPFQTLLGGSTAV